MGGDEFVAVVQGKKSGLEQRFDVVQVEMRWGDIWLRETIRQQSEGWVDISSGREHGDMGVSKESMDGVDGEVLTK